MRLRTQLERFRREEEGTLLVFFAVCSITILGIVALSFDMGRRAATQTDMQAYADNVALAAAGELDRQPGAIASARRAAEGVIATANEQIRAGTAGQTVTMTLDEIVFYENLPDIDTPASFDVAALSDPASPSYKYALPPTDLEQEPDPQRANYIGVRLNTVDVDWMFGNIFGGGGLPDAAVGAVAVAGEAEFSCDVAPLMFCLPRDGNGPEQLAPGRSARLSTARMGAAWQPGDFGFLRVGLDPAGPCAAIGNEAGRQACLITMEERIAACFQARRSNIETGQRPFQETGMFNMGFDMFGGSMVQFASDPDYAPGPHSISGLQPAGPGDECTPSAASDTMPFPLDDCFPEAGGAGCPDGAFGDGGWEDGRERYVETNYTVWQETFDPDEPAAPRTELVPGDFFDFQDTSLSRYEFYLREIERAENGGIVLPAHPADNDGGRGSPFPEAPEDYTTWDDYWPDDFSGLNPIIPDARWPGAPEGADNGLPQCNMSRPSGNDPDRRVILAAGIDCPAGAVTGNAEGVAIEDYYRLFLLAPVSDTGGLPPEFDIHVEVVGRIPVDAFADRSVVQLYR